jgi:serine/threonine protein kinase
MNHAWSANRHHLARGNHHLSVFAKEVRELEHSHAQLLWRDIPKALMPRFVLPNPRLIETEAGVGNYTFVRPMSSRFGIVKEATSEDRPKVVIKVVDKKKYLVPGEVEGIYREFLFCKAVVKHPNVIKAVELLHGSKKIYMVMQHGGDVNLKHHLLSLPDTRMTADSAVYCFRRLASAVNFIHDKMIAHRDISADHVVVRTDSCGGQCPQLCDFRMATTVKEGLTSLSCCGKLPYMAPEILFGRPSAPLPTDCWSMGVLLLEMAAGMGSFFKAVSINDNEIELLDVEQFSRLRSLRTAIASRIEEHFDTAGNHAKAIEYMGAECSDGVSQILTGLLTSVDRRLSMEHCIISSTVLLPLDPLELQ